MSSYQIFKNIKTIVCGAFLLFSNSSYANYYIACYYYNSDQSVETNNFTLGSHEITGAAKNYYWAVNDDSLFSSYTELEGRIEDGIFIENNLTYNQAIQKCNLAIQKGLVLWPSKETYKLYDMKASTSNFTGYEYPIQFRQENQSNSIKRLVVFGDSLSDTGNLNRWTKVFPTFPYWFGRLSNGLLWNEYLSNSTKLPVLNWAYSGAQSAYINDINPSDFLNYIKSGARNVATGSMKGEVDRYLANWLTSDSYKTTNKHISNPQETLFMIWIGGNDFLSKTENATSFHNFIEHPDSVEYYENVSNRTVNNIIEQIKKLNDAGAYHFVVFNMPNMGIAPFIANNNDYDFTKGTLGSKTELSHKMTSIMQHYNAVLKSKIDLLNAERRNKLNVDVIDVYSALEMLMQNKNIITGGDFDYEFHNEYSTVATDESHHIPLNCYKGGFLLNLMTKNDASANQLSTQYTCKKSNGSINTQSLFWDDEHPTSYTYCYFSYLVQNALYTKGLIQNAPSSLEETKKLCKIGSFEKT